MSKRFALILMAFVAVFIGLLVVNNRDADAPSGDVSPTSHTIGEGTAGVTLIEYGDFQCRGCYQYYPVVKQVKEKYGDQITFQFRHFPIVSSHPNAMAAHRAAEAAGLQGKFFEMHDMLFEGLPSWETTQQPANIFEQYAESIGLDMERYRQDVSSNEVNRAIQADMRAGNAIGVNGTPTFVINDKVVENDPRDLEGFSKLIDEAMQDNSEGEESQN